MPASTCPLRPRGMTPWRAPPSSSLMPSSSTSGCRPTTPRCCADCAPALRGASSLWSAPLPRRNQRAPLPASAGSPRASPSETDPRSSSPQSPTPCPNRHTASSSGQPTARPAPRSPRTAGGPRSSGFAPKPSTHLGAWRSIATRCCSGAAITASSPSANAYRAPRGTACAAPANERRRLTPDAGRPTQTKRRGPARCHNERDIGRAHSPEVPPAAPDHYGSGVPAARASPPRRLACASSYEPLLRCLVVSAGLLRPLGVVFGPRGAVHQGQSRPLERRGHPLGDLDSLPFRGVWLHTFVYPAIHRG